MNDKKILKIIKKDISEIHERDFKTLREIVFLTLKTKIKFFVNDIYENNQRLCLNFGHTFAHAIEMALQTNKGDVIRHGEAVGIGMLCEIFYNEGKSKNFYRLKKYLELFKLPTSIEKFYNLRKKNKIKKNIYENIFLDKKKISKFPRIISIKSKSPRVIEMRSNKMIMNTIEKIVLN